MVLRSDTSKWQSTKPRTTLMVVVLEVNFGTTKTKLKSRDKFPSFSCGLLRLRLLRNIRSLGSPTIIWIETIFYQRKKALLVCSAKASWQLKKSSTVFSCDLCAILSYTQALQEVRKCRLINGDIGGKRLMTSNYTWHQQWKSLLSP